MGLDIEEAISEIRDNWMDINGVTGVGLGKTNDKDCILVMVSSITPEIKKNVPKEYKGFPVEIMEVGDINIQETDSGSR